jgi:hypothetical protein
MNLRKVIRRTIREQSGYHSSGRHVKPANKQNEALVNVIVDLITGEYYFQEEEIIRIREKVEDLLKEIL